MGTDWPLAYTALAFLAVHGQELNGYSSTLSVSSGLFEAQGRRFNDVLEIRQHLQLAYNRITQLLGLPY
jgi:hypothetical protein